MHRIRKAYPMPASQPAPQPAAKAFQAEMAAVRNAHDAAARTRVKADQSKRHDAIVFGACILVLLMALAELKRPSTAVRPSPLPVAAASQ
jgi:hypothetical protein